jgi:hypothetical protein
VKRIKLIIVTAVAMAVMVGAAVSPAQAVLVDWGWTEWMQWGPDSPWWCSWAWSLDSEIGYQTEQVFCYNGNTGELWAWPEV